MSGELCLNGGSCVIEAEMERGYRCECTGEFQVRHNYYAYISIHESFIR